MYLEKNYYDEFERLMLEIDKEAEADEASLSDIERLRRQKEQAEEIDLLFDIATERIEQSEKTVSKKKVDRFYLLVKKADYLASRLEANFSAQISKTYKGIIRFLGPQMVIDDSWETGELRILSKLISSSNDLWVDTVERNGTILIQIELVYDLSDFKSNQP